jgi:hypothetical protein
VHETRAVNRRDAGRDLLRDPPELVGRVAALGFLPADVRVERLALDVLHHENRPVPRGRQVVNSTHVRVADAARQEQLLTQRFVVAGHARLFADDLESDRLLGRSVIGEKHLAHPPLAEALPNLVPVVEDRAGGDRRRASGGFRHSEGPDSTRPPQGAVCGVTTERRSFRWSWATENAAHDLRRSVVKAA